MSKFPKHHGMREKPAMEFLCSPDSYEFESQGSFGRLFRSVHHARPLYCHPNTIKEMGKTGGIMDSGNNASLSNTVPAGMVFLGQFIDHDITLDTESSLGAVNDPEDITNFRTPGLDLDCIFGEGPEDEPFLYEKNSLKLLTGETNNNIGQGPQLEKQDLARNGQGVAIIGDPRNDENRILSQLQLLFIRFYNKVYDAVAGDPDFNHLDEKGIYDEARKLVTWHYHWMVINEFLPTMIGEDLMTDIMTHGRHWYTPEYRVYIPVEFSVAAYRFGHSMIPQKVRLQNGGPILDLFSPAVGIGFAPLANLNQVVEWEMFFNVNGNHQFAEKLDTKLASSLLALPFITSGENSLATRNLLRGQSFLLPSGETVAGCMGIDPSIQTRVADRIADNLNGSNLEFPNGTPLWYYILAEAEEIGKDGDPGEGLGPVGGRIVGETILGLIESDHNSFMNQNRNWTPTIGDGVTFGMKEIIGYV